MQRNGVSKVQAREIELLGFLTNFGSLPGLFPYPKEAIDEHNSTKYIKRCHYNRVTPTRLPSSESISRTMNDVYCRWELLMYVAISSCTYAIYAVTKDFGGLIDFSMDFKLSTLVLRFKCMDRVVILSDHLLQMFLKQISHQGHLYLLLSIRK